MEDKFYYKFKIEFDDFLEASKRVIMENENLK